MFEFISVEREGIDGAIRTVPLDSRRLSVTMRSIFNQPELIANSTVYDCHQSARNVSAIFSNSKHFSYCKITDRPSRMRKGHSAAAEQNGRQQQR